MTLFVHTYSYTRGFPNLCNTSVKCKARNMILYVSCHLFTKATVDSEVLKEAGSDVKDHVFALRFTDMLQRFGKPQYFACKIPKILLEIIICTNEMWHFHEMRHGICMGCGIST